MTGLSWSSILVLIGKYAIFTMTSALVQAEILIVRTGEYRKFDK